VFFASNSLHIRYMLLSIPTDNIKLEAVPRL
jgi:hypothetical protein